MKTNIEIPVADLKAVLPGLAKVISKRSGLPVLGSVKVTLNADRTLHLQATNLDQFVTARLDKSYRGTPGVMLVPFTELTDITKKCSADDTIELSVTDEQTIITYPAAGTRITKPVKHLGVDEFPPATEVNTEPIKLDDAFKQALREALDCASTNESRYVITGACLDVSKKEAHYVVGTNGSHLYSANSFLFDVPNSIIVPPGKFLTWAGFVDDGPWTLRFQPEIQGKGKARTGSKPAMVRLDSDHWTFVTKPIEGEYPNWKQIVPPTRGPSRIILGEPGIKTIFEALPLLPGIDHQNQPVSLEMTDRDLVLKARTSENERWNCIPVPARVAGPPVTISVNRTYLAKALKFGCTEIAISDPSTPFICSTKGKTMVIAPLGPGSEAARPAAQPPPVQPPVAQVAAVRPISRTENVSAETPSTAETTTETDNERTQAMPANTPMTAPQRSNLTSHKTEGETSAIDEVMEKIDAVKTNLRGVLDDLKEMERLLDRAVKEKKAGEKEINRARTALRSLQSVEL